MKTVFITGCSSGIGNATAIKFANEGWNVVATMRNPETSTLPKRNEIMVSPLDVTDLKSVQSAIRAGIERFGHIDVLINNAGYGQNGLFEAIPREKIQEQFDVNVFGVMDVTRAMLPHFRQNKSGLIINVSSGAGLFTLPMLSLYCASKFALEGFTEALSYELASQNIGVKSVIPHGGVTNTRFVERAREGMPKEISSDYHAFAGQTREAFARMVATRNLSSDDVAKVIYEAATDGTDRLRYLVGDDARGFIKARQPRPDQEYVDYMRAFFK